MVKRFLFSCISIVTLLCNLYAQQNNIFSVNYIEKEQIVSPGQIVNLAFMVSNNSSEESDVNCILSAPPEWKIIIKSQRVHYDPEEKKLVLFTVQVASTSSVGKYSLQMAVVNPDLSETISTTDISLRVKEIEKISLLLIKAPQNINAGDTLKATYLIQNQGNTTKRVFVETQNCDVNGSSEIEVGAGKSVQFDVLKKTSPELTDAIKEYFTVRALVSGEVKKSIYRSVTVFPTERGKKDLFFRFPVSLTTTYVASNLRDKFETGYQFQISGNGALDPEEKHHLEFLARGPNFSNLSYLGLYDQYFISYSNKNIELFVGEKAYSFTPLTESFRFGFGTENKIIFNNGFNFGFIYVKPRFYEDFQNEISGFTGFEFDKDNEIKLFYVQKNNEITDNSVRLASFSARLAPFKKTNMEVEFSRGYANKINDNAFRTSINTQVWIFHLAGIYFYTGKNYPGYFSNSTFYSGNISTHLTQKLSLGLFAKEDFKNAALDTFFVSAPYTKSLQASINYNIAQRAYLRFYWQQFERKDRLVFDKFHYKTNSVNTHFNHKFRKIGYDLFGEFGKTTNLLLSENNQQTTYRGTANFGYHFNSKNSIRLTGSWSNINSFVTDDRRNVTAGIFVVSQITKNIKADFHVQNAYDIDDYYRNRNLMQFNLEYNFLKHHTITAHSFYTLFKQRVNDPEITATVSYVYKFGVPLKQVIKGGDVKGQITYENGEPAEGVVLNLQNKSAITDKNGEFVISTVQPGRHLLFVDRSGFEINQVTNIPSPIEVDVIEDQETGINFKITTGAKLTGKVSLSDNNNDLFGNSNENTGGIIVELKNEFDLFRITTDGNGNFSFPLVRPGNYTFRIYENSIPDGYELEKSEYEFNFSSGEEQNLQIELKSKKRNIIFKSQNLLLTPLENANQPINQTKAQPVKSVNTTVDSIYYSVQVGAFNQRQTSNSGFFAEKHFDFEKQIDNMYKYFIGRFKTFEEAKKEREKLETQFKNPFVVLFKNDVLQK